MNFDHISNNLKKKVESIKNALQMNGRKHH